MHVQTVHVLTTSHC